MRTKSKFLMTFLTAGLALTFAQGPQGGPGQGQGKASRNGNGDGQPQLDMSVSYQVTGEVKAVNLALGGEDPSIEVDGKLIKLAPAWFIDESGFDLSGTVVVNYVKSLDESSGYVYAIDIAKTGGDALPLRDPLTGQPLWIGGRGNRWGGNGGHRGDRGNGGNGSGAGSGVGSCLDMASAVTASGAIAAVTTPAGIRQTRIALLVDGSGDDPLIIRVGPMRLVIESGLALSPGLHLGVTYVTDTCTGDLVATSLITGAGVTIPLRNEFGGPAW